MEYLAQLDVRLTERAAAALREGSGSACFSFFAHSGDSWFWLAGLGLVWLWGGTAWHNNPLSSELYW
jgi:hypothetical protein